MPHKRLLGSLAGGALVAGLLVGTGGNFAFATPETGPDSRACVNAKIAEGEALAALKAAEKDERQFKKAAEDGTGETAESKPDNVTGISAPEQAKLDRLHGDVLRLQEELDKAVAKREEKCAEADPEPAPPANPGNGGDNGNDDNNGQDDNPPAFVDKDCADVTQEEALALLGTNDPHNLDVDNDGIPCEVDEGEDTSDPQVDDYPVGGVATGGGPAL